MSTRPWMPLYVADFQMATRDLDHAEKGAYLDMLMLMWERDDAALPNDMDWLKRVMHMHGHMFKRIVPRLLNRYFELGDDGLWRNKRLTKERQKAIKTSAKQSQNAIKRWRKDKENKATSDATAMPLDSDSHSDLESKKERESPRAKARPSRKTQIPEDWWPSDAGLEYARQTFSAEQADIEAQRFRDYWRGCGRPMVDWEAVWRNWVRRAPDFKPRPPPASLSAKDRSHNSLEQMREQLRLCTEDHSPSDSTVVRFAAIKGH